MLLFVAVIGRQDRSICIPVTRFRNTLGFSHGNLILNGPAAMLSKIYLIFFRINKRRFFFPPVV